MRNVYELLRHKELALERVRSEVKALRAVVPLLAEPNDPVVSQSDLAASPALGKNKWPLKVQDTPRVPFTS